MSEEDITQPSDSPKKSDSPKPETEEQQSPLQRYRPYGLSVSDLRDQMWCEKQMEFGLTQKKRTTEAMASGQKRHRALHEEVTEIIEVKPTTKEDRWGLYFFNAGTALCLLEQTGLSREIPVFGQIGDLWLLGIIDQIEVTPRCTLSFLDTKTRQRPRLPGYAQKQTTHLQMMLYRKLFVQLARQPFCMETFFAAKKLSGDVNFSDEFLAELEPAGLSHKTLNDLIPWTMEQFQKTPKVEMLMSVRYEWQQDHSLLGVDQFPYQEHWLQQKIKASLPFWRGQRDAQGLQSNEGWKCRYCQFAEQCELSPNQ